MLWAVNANANQFHSNQPLAIPFHLMSQLIITVSSTAKPIYAVIWLYRFSRDETNYLRLYEKSRISFDPHGDRTSEANKFQVINPIGRSEISCFEGRRMPAAAKSGRDIGVFTSEGTEQ